MSSQVASREGSRSATPRDDAPAAERYDDPPPAGSSAYDHPNPGAHGDAASVDSSIPSTLYARCTATASQALNARRMREAVDSDVRFLQNRLSKLQLEERRAKEEIQTLRQKADQVSTSKQRHDDAASQRRALRDQVDYGKRKEAAMIALNKERQAKAVWAAKQKVIQAKREAVLSMRKQKEVNECRVQIQKAESRDVAVKQRSSIRQLQDMARARREREEEAKKEAARQAYEKRLREEEAEREQKEQLAAQLIAQEAQMIYRLKRMHQEKQVALRGLADAVTGQTPARARGSPSPAHETPSMEGSRRSLPPL